MSEGRPRRYIWPRFHGWQVSHWVAGSVICLLLIILSGLFHKTNSQGMCQNPPQHPTIDGWAQGSTVRYNFPASLSGGQQTAVSNAFRDWNSANQDQNGSNVSFQPGGTQLQITTCNTSGCANLRDGTPAVARFEANDYYADGELVSATIVIDVTVVDTDAKFEQVLRHEVGHTMGLGDIPSDPNRSDCGWSAGASLMSGVCNGVFTMATSITTCDNVVVSQGDLYRCGPAPTGCLYYDTEICECLEWSPPSGGCITDLDCTCNGSCNWKTGECTYTIECSPIIIAVGPGSDYRLTSATDGVRFDLDGDGVRERIAWTRAGDPVAFLVFDRNQNGLVDDGTELFGNHSVLPSGEPVTNGFEALRFYDRSENGGNGDGVIDYRDSIWNSLQLWVDWNHSGTSEPDELYSLSDFDLSSISLEFETISRADGYGNVFRLKAPCQMGARTRFGFDVFFSAKPQRRPK